MKQQAGDGESAADQNCCDDPRQTDGKQNDALICGERPETGRALHQGAQRHAHRAHSQSNQHRERERGKQHSQQPQLPAVVLAAVRVPGLLPGYFHDSPPKVNFMPRRNVKGNAG